MFIEEALLALRGMDEGIFFVPLAGQLHHMKTELSGSECLVVRYTRIDTFKRFVFIFDFDYLEC